MEFRELGKSGAKVSAIGVGCWAAGGTFWGGTDDAKTADAFGRALDLGVNLFDTAPAYGFGHSERLLAPLLKKHRGRIFLATKFGLVWTEEKVEAITNSIAPKSIKAECDASLKRLGVETIDLYQCHWPLPGDAMTRTVSEDMMAALHSLRDAGKIRYIGVSNFSPSQMDLCGGGKELASNQPPLSILRPGAAREIIPYCKEQGIGVLCYSPMFRGLLTGKYNGDEVFPKDDTRSSHPDYSGERFREICKRVKLLEPYARAHATTIAGIALNWVLSTPGVTCALAGTRSKDQIEGAIPGQGWSLSPKECCEISGIFEGYTK